MAGDERIRLFCALELPEDARAELVAWGDAELHAGRRVRSEDLHAGRRVRSEDLHVTLAFLGSRPAGEIPDIVGELRAASSAAQPVELRPRRYRETRSVGMMVLDDPSGVATALADDLQQRLERLGVYRREARQWLPHVTVLRFRERAGLRPEVPNICLHVVRSALYRSTLGAGGARYDALETAALGGT